VNAQARQTLLAIADDELVLGWRDSEWTGIAPVLEEDVAFSSIAQNEIGHARAIYQLLSDDADALAFDRSPNEYLSSPAGGAALRPRLGADDRAAACCTRRRTSCGWDR
jgi:1,2-phenylacetyl-CoA epoxidase catalytic subunit